MPRRLLSPWVVAALGAAVYLLVAPPSADLAAQEYRADLGLALWNNGWFAGHHTPGYSVLFPPLGHLLGARLTGALAAIAAAMLFTPLAIRHWGPRAGGAAALWFAAAAAAMLLTGRLTFLLGVAIGVGALLALARERRLLAALLAAITTLASPVAGLFVALSVAAWALAAPAEQRVRAWGWGVALGAAALAPVAVTLVLFPEGGDHPLPPLSFWPALAAILAVAALLPAHERALRIGALLYALLLVAAFVVDSPLGGNSTRLGALAAGPVALGALLGRRNPLLLAVLALPLAYWPLHASIRDVVRATGDPSVQASYYRPLMEFLQSRTRVGSFRVEIAPTANHWEARHVAGGRDGVALARGWERQLDRRYGAIFYDERLDAATYRAWLDRHAVAYVAVPDVPLDGAGRDEARLVAAGLPYLRQVWRDAHWRVFAVRGRAPLAQGPAGAPASATLSPAGVTIRASGAGPVLVRVRFTRWWRVTGGRGCVSEAGGGMTRVSFSAAGTISLHARLSGDTCRR